MLKRRHACLAKHLGVNINPDICQEPNRLIRFAEKGRKKEALDPEISVPGSKNVFELW